MAFSVAFFPNPAAEQHLLRAADGPTGRLIARLAVQVESRAKQLAPVDTGRLRGSITWGFVSGGEVAADVGSNVEYAPFQELGTRYQSGTPFLRPALQAVTGA